MHGTGRIIFQNGSVYKGKIKQDILEGPGVLKLPGGAVYDGMFHKNNFHGKGSSLFNFLGIFTHKDGSYYQGDWVKGKKHGMGEELAQDGCKYEGTDQLIVYRSFITQLAP